MAAYQMSGKKSGQWRTRSVPMSYSLMNRRVWTANIAAIPCMNRSEIAEAGLCSLTIAFCRVPENSFSEKRSVPVWRNNPCNAEPLLDARTKYPGRPELS